VNWKDKNMEMNTVYPSLRFICDIFKGFLLNCRHQIFIRIGRNPKGYDIEFYELPQSGFIART
jgi:hypothetical protein